MNGKGGFYEKVLDLAQRVGPTAGGGAGFFYFVAYLIYFFKERDMSNLAQASFGLGFASIAVGFGRAQKKATDMFVSSEAEKRIDNPNLANSSLVPQIQNEIDKINEATKPEKE